MSRRRYAVPVIAVVVLALSACGDDDTSSAPAVGDDTGGESAGLTVIAEDISFPSDTYAAEAGTVDVIYENEGSIEHTLLIDGVDDFKLTVTANGDVDEGSVELEPGTYDLYCDVAGHRSAGMEATLEVG